MCDKMHHKIVTSYNLPRKISIGLFWKVELIPLSCPPWLNVTTEPSVASEPDKQAAIQSRYVKYCIFRPQTAKMKKCLVVAVKHEW